MASFLSSLHLSKLHVSACAHVCLSVCVQSFSSVGLFATPWTVTHWAPLSMAFPRQEYWRGLPFPAPRDLPDPGIEPTSSFAGGFFFFFKPLSHLGSPQAAYLHSNSPNCARGYPRCTPQSPRSPHPHLPLESGCFHPRPVAK